MLELYLRGRSMRIIEFIKRLFHREKPIEIKQKKYLNPSKKMKQKKKLNQNLQNLIQRFLKRQQTDLKMFWEQKLNLQANRIKAK